MGMIGILSLSAPRCYECIRGYVFHRALLDTLTDVCSCACLVHSTIGGDDRKKLRGQQSVSQSDVTTFAGLNRP